MREALGSGLSPLRPLESRRGALRSDPSRRRAGESSEAPHGKALSWYLAGSARSSLPPLWSLPLPLLRKRNVASRVVPTQFAVSLLCLRGTHIRCERRKGLPVKLEVLHGATRGASPICDLERVRAPP